MLCGHAGQDINAPSFAASTASAPAPAADDVVGGLLSFRDSIPGFNISANLTEQEWVEGSAPCGQDSQASWQYVICSNGIVTGINFTTIPLGG